MQYELIGQTTDDFDTDVGLSAIAHIAAIGKLDLAVLIPFQSGEAFNRTTPKATIDAKVADYGGYADAPLTWTLVTLGPDGKRRYEATTPQLRPADGTSPNQIGGFTVQNAAKTKVYMVFNIAGVGLPLRDAMDAISAQLAWPPSGVPVLALTV